ncbi:MAG: hypothetical protein WBN10_05240 [Polyangiales bacterium]
MKHVTDTQASKHLDLLFFAEFALLATHERDAVAHAERRLLPCESQ